MIFSEKWTQTKIFSDTKFLWQNYLIVSLFLMSSFGLIYSHMVLESKVW